MEGLILIGVVVVLALSGLFAYAVVRFLVWAIRGIRRAIDGPPPLPPRRGPAPAAPELAQLAPDSPAPAAHRGDLEVTRRQLHRWFVGGKLDEITYHKLLRVIARDLATPLRTPARANPAAPAAAPEEPEEATAEILEDDSSTQKLPPATPLSPPDFWLRRYAGDPKTPPGTPPSTPPKSSPQAAPATPVGKPSVAPAATPPGFLDELVAAPSASSNPKLETPNSQSPRPPRRSFPDLLAAFMEESHIRWGELVGGMLIILCSVALVVSLWSHIAHIPVLKYYLFTGVTVAVFGLGFYSHHRWRLPMTSRGLLIIGALLVPLNFLALAAFAQGAPARAPLVLGSEAAAVLAFAVPLWFMGRLLLPDAPQAGAPVLMLGVLLPSLAQLVVARVVTDFGSISDAGLVVLGGGPWLIYAAAVASVLYSAWPAAEIDAALGLPRLTFLGLASFAAVLPLALLVHKSGEPGPTLHAISPIVNLYGLPALACGLVLWRGVRKPEAAWLRTTGTAVGLLGVLVMLVGMGMAWPEPARLVPVTLAGFLILTAIAILFEIPTAHWPALACLTVALALLLHVARGAVGWHEEDAGVVTQALLGNVTGPWLTAWAAVLLGVAGLLRRGTPWGPEAPGMAEAPGARRTHAAMIAIAGIAAGALSLVLVSYHGFGRADDHGAVWIYAGYTVAAFIAAGRLRRQDVTWLALLLLLAALAQGLMFRFAAQLQWAWPWKWVGLIFTGLTLAGWLASRRARPEVRPAFAPPLGAACAIAAVLSVVMVSAHGFGRGDDHGATWVYLIYTVVLFAGAILWPGEGVTWLGALALLVTLAQALMYRFDAVLQWTWPGQIVGLTFGTLTLAGWLAARWANGRARPDPDAGGGPEAGTRAGVPQEVLHRAEARCHAGAHRWQALETTLGICAAATAVLMAAMIGERLVVAVVTEHHLHEAAWRLARREGYAAVLLLLASVGLESAALFAFGQVAVGIAGVAAVLGVLAGPDWWTTKSPGVLFPWTQQSIAVTLAVLGLAWIAARRLMARVRQAHPWLETLDEVMNPAWHPVDGYVASGLVAWLWVLAAWGCVPGVFGELSPHQATAAASVSPAAWHMRALGWGSWLLLGALALDQFTRQWEGFRSHRVFKLLAVLAAAVPLLAGRWEGQWATASMLRWLAAAYLLVVSAALWLEGWWGSGVVRLAWPEYEARGRGLAEGVRATATTLVGVLLTILTLMGVSAEPNAILPGDATVFARLGQACSYGLPLLVLALVMVGHACQTRRTGYAWAAGLQLHLAVSLPAIQYLVAHPPVGGAAWRADALVIVQLNAIVAGLYGAGWAWVRRWSARVRPTAEPPAPATETLPGALAPWGFFVKTAAALVGLLAVWGLGGSAAGEWVHANPWLTAGAWASAVLGTAALLRDEPGGATSALYLLGLGALALVLDQFNLDVRWLAWWGAVALPVYSAAVAGLARRRRTAGLTWLTPATVLLAGLGLLLTFGCVFSFAAPWLKSSEAFAVVLRLVAGVAVLGHGVTLGLLTAPGEDNAARRIEALLVGAAAGTAIAWSWIAPTSAQDTLINRGVMFLVAMAGVLALYALAAKSLPSAAHLWRRAVARITPALLGLGAAAALLVLGAEVVQQLDAGHVTIATWAVFVIVAALGGSAIAGVLMATIPGYDVLGLPLKRRMAYVYGAELLLGLLFLHLRLTLPWLFHGPMIHYWTLVVMGLAFLGAGLSEYLRRSGVLVLAQPLGNTAAFLPLLPVLGFWAIEPQRVDYAALLLVVGLLYTVLAGLRRSFGFGLLAALAANGALWDFLRHTDHFTFVEHPQLWLIPPALCVLAAAQLNARRLEPGQLSTIRYLGLSVIYISSTVEIFLHGVPRSPWLPMVLAVGGVMLGIALRVRSFLFMGATFLLMALVAMIWHAAANPGWTWLWWVAGIALGAGIIALFAAFERKREAMLAMVRELKQWEA